MMLLRSALAAFSLVAAAPAFAGQAADARLYGHLPYPDADPAMLVAAPEGFDLRQPCLLRREVLPDLTALIAAPHPAGVTGTVQGVSCYRQAAHHRAAFCDPHPDRNARFHPPEN